MCLTNATVKMAFTAKTCYKMLFMYPSGVISSPYQQGYLWTIGETQEAIGTPDVFKTNARKAIDEWMMDIDKGIAIQYTEDDFEVSQGFIHASETIVGAAKNIICLLNVIYEGSINPIIVECEIPEGNEYFDGGRFGDREFAARTMKTVKIVPKEDVIKSVKDDQDLQMLDKEAIINALMRYK